MAAQGWVPGSYLGAKNAAHASHYTDANASHIRVLLKDDNLGLGAGSSKSDGENFGLGSFQDILGRLNGKSGEQIKKEQAVRADLGRRSYVEKKWGPSRFVSGGYLVSEKVEESKEEAFKQSPVELDISSSFEELSKKENPLSLNKHEKRKLAEATQPVEMAKSSKRLRDGETKEERHQRKAERRQRKEERRLKKSSKAPEAGLHVHDAKDSNLASTTETQPVRPVLTFAGGRQAVRQRYIRQKKLASMDANAMREVRTEFSMHSRITLLTYFHRF